MQEERFAYHAATKPNLQKVLQKFVNSLLFEIQIKAVRYENENRLPFFDKIITYKEVLCKKGESGEYEIDNTLL